MVPTAERCSVIGQPGFVDDARALFWEPDNDLDTGLAQPVANHLPGKKIMSDWLHGLPVLWMAILVFGLTYLVTVGIYAVIAVFAVGERARSFKAIAPGLLSPLGIIFGLFVVFTAAQVWTDNEKARAEIDREASALRSAAILAAS